jgi:hypothetical protein
MLWQLFDQRCKYCAYAELQKFNTTIKIVERRDRNFWKCAISPFLPLPQKEVELETLLPSRTDSVDDTQNTHPAFF